MVTFILQNKAMAKPPYRPGPYARALKSFWDSISPRKVFPPKAELIGKDPFGNKYYEIPADPRYLQYIQ